MSLSLEEQDIVATVRQFVDREVRPVVRDLERANEYPAELIEQMMELGIFGLAVPEPYGDVQVSVPHYVLITEELARGWMSLAGAMCGHTVVAKLLATFGTEEQKQAGVLHRVRRREVLPLRADHDRRRGHQRDPAERDRLPAHRPRRAVR